MPTGTVHARREALSIQSSGAPSIHNTNRSTNKRDVDRIAYPTVFYYPTLFYCPTLFYISDNPPTMVNYGI
jgi:hypothetical protein